MAESMGPRFQMFIFVCGVALFACGLANAVSAFIWMDYADYDFFIFSGDGIWSGIGLMINGAFGVVVSYQRSKIAAGYFIIVSMMVFLSSVIQAWLSVLTYIKVRNHLDSLPCKAQDETKSSCIILDGQERIDAIWLTIRTASTIGAVLCLLSSIVTSITLRGQQVEEIAMAEDGNAD